jgi:hypothetical protein
VWACVGHEFGTGPRHNTSAKFVYDMCPICVPISGCVSCTKKDPGSRFIMQVGAVRCFGVHLRVTFLF